jgi:predicted nuclease of predicted toxin-antitoxin system
VKFYLDNDVDARCRRVLSPPHDCWTAAQAGRAFAADDDQTVYADDAGAVIITHDREFTERRKRNTAGRHIRLCCEQPDGPHVLQRWLPDILAILDRRRYVVIELRQDSYQVFADWQ